MKRALIISAGAMAAVLGATGTASAAAVPRLQGNFAGTLTRTHSTDGSPTGATQHVTRRFVPQCAKGACTTKMSYNADGVTGITATLKLTDRGYEGQVQFTAPCHAPSGLIRNGYHETDTFSLRVTKVSGGRAVAYAGLQMNHQVPTGAVAHANKFCDTTNTQTYSIKATRQ
jgi:hypothetical protein